MITKEEILSKIWGCLVGAAYGDAVGAPTENRTREQIFDKWGYVDRLYDAPPDVYARGNIAGQVTDDFSMAYTTINEILNSEGIISDEIADRALLEWAKDERFLNQFVGPTSRKYIDKLKGISIEESGEFHPANDNSKGSNGGAMKIGPVACFAKGDPGKTLDIVRIVCGHTHGNKISMGAACSVAMAVCGALAGKDLINILTMAIEGAEKGEHIGEEIAGPSIVKRLKTAITIGLNASDLNEAMDKLRLYFDCSGMAADSVPVSFGLIVAAKGDAIKAIHAAANIGNDTDTMATIVGAILGAYHGIKAFSGDIIDHIDKANHYDLKKTAENIINTEINIKL